MKIILASKSPIRKGIMEKLGVEFEVDVSEIDEKEIGAQYKNPNELVMRLAEAKTEAVAQRHENAIVIGSDTMVLFQNKILGKPKTFEAALEMMKNFAGKEQHIVSGFCVINTANKTKSLRFLDNVVLFKNYSEDEIKKYLEETTPTLRAGAYKLEEVMDRELVEKFDGTGEACSGFDLDFLKELFKKEGYLS